MSERESPTGFFYGTLCSATGKQVKYFSPDHRTLKTHGLQGGGGY